VGNDPLRKMDIHTLQISTDVIKMEDKEKFAYMAGLIDGEGTITFVKRGSKYPGKFIIRVIVVGTSKELFDWISKEFGGTTDITKVGERKAKIQSTQDMYYWYITTQKAVSLLRECYPFLVIKKRQAELIFEYAQTIQKTTVPLTQELIGKRQGIYQKLRDLHKGRGRNQVPFISENTLI